jgi:hypothetical protein
MGYKGRDVSDKQERFTRLLESLNISYDEIDHKHPLAIEYPCVQKEIQTISKNNIEKKKWICMNPRTFKKVILRLNTENAELVRDYYLNLEEAMFAYGEYTAGYLIKKAESARISRERELVDAISKLAIKDKELALVEDQVKREHDARVRAERKAIRVHKFMNRITIKEHKLEWIYIGTTQLYAQERIFKIGSTVRLSSRIPQYNTGRPNTDRLLRVGYQMLQFKRRRLPHTEASFGLQVSRSKEDSRGARKGQPSRNVSRHQVYRSERHLDFHSEQLRSIG